MSQQQDKKKLHWRRWLVSLHRELGFFAFGLTLVYALSGIAVNHREDWDYNYSTDRGSQNLGSPAQLLGLPESGQQAGSLARQNQQALVIAIGQKLQRSQPPKKVFWRGPDRLSLFYAQGERDLVDYHPGTGRVDWLRKKPRLFFRLLNRLHLNELRGLWTWMADAYALILLFLAISGVVVVKGRRGLRGRGGLWLLAGIVLPIVLYVALSG